MTKIDIKNRYRELISALLPEIEDEEKLHELYVHALMISKTDDSAEKGGAR